MTNLGDGGNALGVEQIPDGEAEAIRKVIDIELQLLRRRIDQEHLGTPERPVPRGQHPKHHGCVRAEFVIDNDIPKEFRRGVFVEPGKTFPAWIRFSNARKQDDRQPGGHGMAIKLMGVDGEQLLEEQSPGRTQDFLLLDSPVFFLKNAVEFAEFDAAHLNSEISWFDKLSPLGYFVKHPREFAILLRIEHNRSLNPLDTSYWSATPYKLGIGAVKYKATPVADGPPVVATPSENQLRDAMKLQLQARDAFFHFWVQPQLDPTEQPIEDGTHEWLTPPTKVATIRIPSQSFDSPTQMAFCENLSFNPWHGLTDHRPLGSLNRLRRATYLALSDFRRHENHVPCVEPTPETTPKG
jgi:Catalase